VRSGNLTVSGGKLAINANGLTPGVSVVNSTAVTGGAQLDLSDNHLIDHISAIGTWNGSAYDGLTGLIASGRAGNAWTGPGIITTQAAAQNSDYTGLGVAKASDLFPIAATETATWAGQTVSGSDTLVMYTYGGDANLDGKINILDYVRIDQGIAASLTGYANGDFNYDGTINILDYAPIIDTNIAIQGPAFFASGGVSGGGGSGVTAVPEPAVATMAFIGATLATLRRRRRKTEIA
jgi:hypothetical protein